MEIELALFSSDKIKGSLLAKFRRFEGLGNKNKNTKNISINLLDSRNGCSNVYKRPNEYEKISSQEEIMETIRSDELDRVNRPLDRQKPLNIMK